MRIVYISGSHPRHCYIARKLAETGLLVGIVMEKREPMILEVDPKLSDEMKKMFIHHFELRAKCEEKYFGIDDSMPENVPILEVEECDINGTDVERFIKEIDANCIFSYGPGILRENILNLCPNMAFNLHGGLSPWYKGSATMFWPFYFLEPQYVGTTIHKIEKKIDAGNIIHQTVPVLEKGDCMHEVAAKSVFEAGRELGRVIQRISEGNIEGVAQKKTGKLFLVKDWRPEHLKLIYETYEDAIVDYYLDGKIGGESKPKLIRLF